MSKKQIKPLKLESPPVKTGSVVLEVLKQKLIHKKKISDEKDGDTYFFGKSSGYNDAILLINELLS